MLDLITLVLIYLSYNCKFVLLKKKIFFLSHSACGISVPYQESNHAPAVEAQNFNHWTTREVPGNLYFVTAFMQSLSNSPLLVNPKSALLSELVYVFVLEI